MQISEVCTRDVLCAERTTSVADAARLMRQYHCGDIVVVERKDGRRVPTGIVTDRDIVLSVTAADLDPSTVTVGDMIGPELVMAPESESLFAAVERMRVHGVRRMPIIDDEGALAGIVTVDDIIEVLAEETSQLARIVAREQVQERHHRS
jgi:CBS domain-containing protein